MRCHTGTFSQFHRHMLITLGNEFSVASSGCKPMSRMLLLLLMLLLPAVPAYAQPANNARVTQVDSSLYPDVTLYVSVTDPGGKPVGGLTARDFAITEDGQAVAVSDFAGGGANSVSTVLVI